nr:reverse transcriptase domain-containing protein [Tanacetum cinerariifolium]
MKSRSGSPRSSHLIGSKNIFRSVPLDRYTRSVPAALLDQFLLLLARSVPAVARSVLAIARSVPAVARSVPAVARSVPTCMRTRNSYFSNNSSVTIPRRRNKRSTPYVVEPELRTIIEVAPKADNRTMKELLQVPTEGYEEAIAILEINADHLEVKTNLLQLVQTNPYHGFERENPHTHINNFKRITLTLKFRDVSNDVIKLMMFPYSLEGDARVCKTDDMIDKLADQISTLVDIFAKKVVTPAPVKAVEESCITCGGPHAHYNSDATNSNQLSVCVATGTYNQVAP